MTIDGVIYSRGSVNGANTVKAYNRFAPKTMGELVAGTTPVRLNLPEAVDLLGANATAAATGSWIPISDKSNFDAYYFIDGSGGGGAFTLQYRPDSTYDGFMVAAAYSGVTSSSVIQTFEVLNGEYRSINTSGSSMNAMPQILLQYDRCYNHY